MAKNSGTNGTTDFVELATQAQAAAEQARTNAIEALQTQLAEIDGQRETIIAQLGNLDVEVKGTKRRGRKPGSGKRAKNDGTLDKTVAEVLSKAKESMSPTQVAEAVKSAGYKTDSENYSVMVQQSLGRLCEIKVAKRPERGQYVAGSASAVRKFLESFEPAAEAA